MRSSQRRAHNNAVDNMGSGKLRSVAAAGGGITMALDKRRGPLDSFTASGIPNNIHDREEREAIRELCRIYYRTHNLMSTAVDVYSRFPIQGMEIQSKDPGIKRFYEELFFNQLNYETFLIDAGQEFFTVGEVNMMASWNERLGVYDYEEIIDPNTLTVTKSMFDPREFRYHMAVPDNLMEIIETMEPRSDYQILVEQYPEIIKAARESKNSNGIFDSNALGPGFEISSELLSRIVNGPQGELYGTPHMLRAFNLLNMEEGLYAAQRAVADRLYSPLILAKLGSPDLGDGSPWIPTDDQLDDFTQQLTMAMAADTRLMVYHYGVEIESVFGREAVPRFDQDFDRLESKMLEVWGIGEALISGGTTGDAYASSALNSEFLNQLMSSYQKYLKKHFRKRVELIAEVQEHFDYEDRGGVHTEIMEEYQYEDEDGEVRIARRPKLLLPEIEFASLNLRDESQEREFLMALKSAGIPISDEALMVNMDIEFDDQVEQISLEKKKKIIAQSKMLVDVKNALEVQGLPIPPEVSSMLAGQPTPPAPMSIPISNDITSPVNVPGIAMDPNALALAQQNLEATMPQDGVGAAPDAPGAPQMSPGMAPPMPAGPSAPGPFLPRNQIAQRPEISDNMRGSMPRAARRFGTGYKDARNKLTEASVKDAVENQPWLKALEAWSDNLGDGQDKESLREEN